MSPATNRHSRYQGLINRLLDRLLTDGEAVPTAFKRPKALRWPTWFGPALLFCIATAWKICFDGASVVEILSPSNTLAEMEQKKELYFAQGAKGILDMRRMA